MSKVDELRKKYGSVTTTTFNRFVEGDKTPTKKYLEYMLKSWVNRQENWCPSTSTGLIKLVNEFDSLLPYIENKDIYSKEYNDLSLLKISLTKANEIKEEKTFDRDQHVLVLDETDEYLLLQPKTHRGSLRYGAGTRWCTASKNNPSTFVSHQKAGCLVYLIDKKGDKGKNYNKIAFYFRNSQSFLSERFEIYNANDSQVKDNSLLSNGWKFETLVKLTFIYRTFASEWDKTRTAIQNIENVNNILSAINFDTLSKSVEIVEKSSYSDYISDVRSSIEQFINNIKKFENARFTTAEN